MKKMTRKLFAVLLAGTMTVSATGLSALALDVDISLGDVTISNEENVTKVSHYTKEEGSEAATEKKSTLGTDDSVHVTQSEEGPTNNTIKVETDAKVVLDNVNIAADDGESAVEIAAGATADITLKGDNILQGGTNGAGIAVPGGAELTLGSDKEGGTLTAIGNGGVNTETTSGAGIGGTASQGTSGIINIEGLDGLTAEGYGIHASGIGSALKGNSDAITIKDSTIDEVNGGFKTNILKDPDFGGKDYEGGAAIGGGGKGGTCGDITITDSTIHSAHGGSKATAIGGSCWADAGKITIDHSVLEDVVGGSSSAGIGVARVSTSNRSDSAYKANADITIKNGSSVEVTGGEYGAGIGTGYNGNSVGLLDKDGTPQGVLASTKITIEDSTVKAVGGNGGAAIGGGYKGWNTDITIKGDSVVEARGGVVTSKSDRLQNGASAIGTGANGSNGKFGGGKIAIDGTSKVIAVSNGGKWAIDLTCDVSGVAFGYQNMFLSDGSETTYSGEQVKNPLDDCETVPYKNEYVVYMNGQKIVLPANFLCAAVTTGGADGVFHTTNEDGTWYFSHYGTVGSDSEEDRAAYGKADTVEKLGTVTVEMTVTGDLAANSYLHVALRAGGEVPSTPDGDDDDDGPISGDDDDDTDPDTDPDDTEITDEDVPMNDLPGEETPADETPSEELADPDVPLTDLPEEDVPLSDVPRTGDVSGLWLALTVLSGCALMGLAFLSFRKREEA